MLLRWGSLEVEMELGSRFVLFMLPWRFFLGMPPYVYKISLPWEKRYIDADQHIGGIQSHWIRRNHLRTDSNDRGKTKRARMMQKREDQQRDWGGKRKEMHVKFPLWALWLPRNSGSSRQVEPKRFTSLFCIFPQEICISPKNRKLYHSQPEPPNNFLKVMVQI